MNRVAFLVRSYNESAEVVRENMSALDRALGSRGGWDVTVVFVEDGSAPALALRPTEFGLAHADLVFVRHPIRLGPGAALETAMEYVRRSAAPFEAIATFDPDGQHVPEELCTMVETLLAGGVDCARVSAVVMGSRFLGTTTSMRPARRRLLRAARWLLRLFYGFQLTDAHNGMRVFTRRALESIRLKSSDFSYASELLEELRKAGARLHEYPVTIRYTDYSRRKGQKNANALAILKEMILRKLVP